MDRTRFRWTVGRQLAAGFGAVTAIFVIALGVTLGYSASAGDAWRDATRWDRAVAGAGDQLRGTQQQMAAQALYVATGAKRYKAEWEDGVVQSNRGAAAVAALHDPTIARIATTANEADHRHDAAVHERLFPAMARGDHAAALAALRQADRFVRVPLGAQRRIAAYVAAERGADIARAKAAERTARRAGLLAGLVGMLLACGIAVVITRRVVRPLRVVVDRLAMLRDVCVTQLTAGLDALARGDLTVAAEPSTPPIENPGADEVGEVARAFNEIRAKTVESVTSYTESRRRLAALLGDVSASAGTVSAASQQMATTSEETGRAVVEIATAVGEVAQGAERQVRAVEQAKLASAEVAGASALSAEQAHETSAAAVAAREVAERGAGAVAEASEAMGAVRDSSLEATEAIRELGSKSERISGIVETITGIAEQTNLLALNAAIEAARAGEQGRGFAVVADEVRKLAEESRGAASSIAALIAEIQAETARAVEVVEDGARRTEDGVATVEQAREAFLTLGASVQDMNGRVEQIAVAIQQIASSSQQVETDMTEVASVAEQSSASSQQVSASTQQTSASTQQIASSAQDLARTAEQLERLVGQFSLA
jgi:methyl-accepting chemotaxis protein